MPLFGRKKKKEPEKEVSDELPSLSSFEQLPPPQPVEPPKEEKKIEKPSVAPLFVKIDRYRQILTSIGNLKTALMIVKNSLDTLKQIERVRDETFNIVSDVIDKMDQKLIALDNELLRPAGFRETEDISEEQQDIKSIEATVADLQGQIEQLKAELGKMI